MPEVLDNVIVAVMPDPATYSVSLSWANGETTVTHFGHLLGKGVFAAMSDPEMFTKVRIGDRGRSLEWPGDVDFCADALWFAAHPADMPPTARREPAGVPAPASGEVRN